MRTCIKAFNVSRARRFLPKIHILILIMGALFFLGSIMGAFFSNIVDGGGGLLQIDTDSSSLFRFIESFLKYEKTSAFIWLFAFVPSGYVFIFLIIFMKGVSCGFTTAYIISQYGLKGILISIGLFSIQNIILIPTYFLTAYFGINFNLRNDKAKRKLFNIGFSYKPELGGYIFIFAVSGILAIIAALSDINITPVVIGWIS